jgi:effector-binding domain-containing protein
MTIQRRAFLFTVGAGVIAAVPGARAQRGPGQTSGKAGQPPRQPSGQPPGQPPAQTYRVETLTLTPQPVLSVRVQVAPAELEARMKEILPRLVAHALANGIELAGPPFARYFARSAERIDFEAGVPTRKEQPGNPDLGITAGALPAGPAIATVHQGAYERLPEAHAALARWAAAHGKQPGGAAWDLFLTNPLQEPDVARWRTKVFLPLAP